MKSLSRCPSYLVRTEFSYCFRMNVPADLQKQVGKKELRYSLKTGYLGKAKFKARILAGQIQQLFLWVRKGGAELSGLSDEKIQELIQEYLKEYVRGLETRHYETDELPPFLDREGYYGYVQGLDYIKEDIVTYLGVGDYSTVGKIVADLLKRNGIAGVEKESVEFIKLSRAVLKAQLEGIDVEKKQALGVYSSNQRSLPLPLESLPIPEEEPSELLSNVIQMYWEESERANRWGERTKREYKRAYDLLLMLLGDVPMRGITPIRMSKQFREVIIGLPKNFTNKDEYKDVPIADVLKSTVKEERLSTSTINKTIDAIAGMFKYAVKRGLIEKNPAEGLRISEGRRRKRESELVEIFTLEELGKLFHSKEYTSDTHLHPYMFWLPVLALFTGARVEELCQLGIEDVKEINGVWVLDLNEDGGEKRLKTGSSRRLVPLHPFIVEELQFPAHVKQLRVQGELRVFPELKRIAFRWSHSFSQWFTRYRKRCGVIEKLPKSKVFHSFRHTFINWLKQNDFPMEKVKQIVGHGNNDITTGRYGKAYAPERLYHDVVKKISFEVDLSHLKNSKYVKH